MKDLAVYFSPRSRAGNSLNLAANRKPRTAARVLATAVSALWMFLICAAGTRAQTSVLTQHNDIGRTGQNKTETILTPSNVNSSSFGKLFSYTIDGQAYAQPLYVPGVTMGAGTVQAGTKHNVIFVATEHDSVYAFDADSNGGSNASPLWQITLLDSAHGAASGATTVPNGDVSTSDINPEIGITGTPVIDTSTNTLYVVGKTKEGGNYFQRLHALDITTGAEKSGSPVTLGAQVAGNGTGSSGGVLKWDPKWENNRASLLLLNGIIYIGFAAHGDNGPWHGWILAYSASSLQQTGVFCSTANGSGSGIWMSGAGLAADTVSNSSGNPSPGGRLFVATGNGAFNANTPPYTNTMSYGDDFVRLDLNNGTMAVGDHFTPLNQSVLNGADADVASGGVLLLPDQSAGGHTHLMVQAGKEGRIYLVDRDSMGGYNSSSDNIVQEVPVNNSSQSNQNFKISGQWSTPAYWNGNLYFWGNGDNLTQFSFVNGRLGNLDSNGLPNPLASSSESTGFPGATPSISSNGTANGIVWDVLTAAYGSGGAAILLAHNATNVSTTLYSSNQNFSRDNPGIATKFVVPTVTNGKVYVGTSNFLSVYGLLGAGPQAAAPILNPGGESFTGSLSVTITDSTPGASIYYTTDGSTPTTSSKKYSTPVTVSSTQTINAMATASGYVQSSVSSETYNLQTQAVAPSFSPGSGSFTSAQLVTLSSGTAGAKIYYTTDGSTPSPGVGSTQLYGSAITVSSTQTIKALASLAGLVNSPVSSATYTIAVGGSGINFVNGFSSSQSVMTFNGTTGLNDTRLQLTNGGLNQAGSAWFNTPVDITGFTNDFAFQLENADADGITFTIQNSGTNALGGAGGALGYAGIAKSVAIKFDLYSNNGEGDDSTGIYQNGVSPQTPFVDLTNTGIDLHNGDTFSVHMTYNGTTLTMTITDGVTGGAFTTSWPINIAQAIGSNTAYLGFTGGTGGMTASQKILTWTYVSGGGSQTAAAAPSFNPGAGTYPGAQTVTISDTTSGASIFYTTDGSTPATTAGGSTLAYSGPVSVTSTGTLKAIAKSATTAASAVSSASYTIQQPAAAPSFAPLPGTYTTAQSVTLSSSTAGAAIYYTLDGSTPSTSSTRFTSAISVSSSKTIKAMATATGFANSAISTGVYTINATGGGTGVNLGGGFTAGAMVLNGSAALNGTRLRLTDGNAGEAGAAWYNAPVNIQQFTTNFSFQIAAGTNPIADGLTFAIQGNSTAALGPPGGGLGYGPDNTGTTVSPTNPLHNSVAIKFDVFDNAGEGADSTGLYTNGVSPSSPFVDLTSSGIDLHSGHVFNVQMSYDGTNLTMTMTDPAANATFTHAWPVNIPSIVGANSAYVGFTGGTGSLTAIQDITAWTLSSSAGAPAPPPGGTTVINMSSGFSATGMQLNGNATLVGNRLQLSDTSAGFEDSSAFWNQKVNVQSFTNDFTFQLTNAAADGITFTVQGAGVTALGGSGGELGYGPGSGPGIANSVAVKFDLYNNTGEGTNSTGLYTNGAPPTMPAINLGGGVSLQSGDVMAVHMTYDGVTLTMTITDTANPTQTFTTSWPIDIPGTVGATTAYAGFTGATGGALATQQILTWSYSTGKPPLVFQTTNLTATTSGPALRTFSYPGFPDGVGTILDSTAVGDYVVFTVNVATAGIYDVKVAYKGYAPRGIMQAAVNATNLGSPVDEFVAVGDAYGVSDLGKLNFATAGNYLFKFTVVGKNAASTGYSLSFDTITLTPQ